MATPTAWRRLARTRWRVLGANAGPGDLRDFLASLASYVLRMMWSSMTGETIGFAADDKHAITRSPGVGLPEEQITLKISWKAGGDGPGQYQSGVSWSSCSRLLSTRKS